MLTAVPVALTAFWVVFLSGYLWRSAIEAEAGVRIRAVQGELGGILSPTWRGFRLQLDQSRIEWGGSIFGYRTRIRRPSGKTVHDGLLSLEQILAVVDGAPKGRLP